MVILASSGTLAITKGLKASRRVNILVPMAVTMAVILASRPFLSSVLMPKDEPVEYPLTLTQLTGENSSSQLSIDVNSSPLVSHGQYYDFGKDNEIQYTLVDIHCPLFYDMILNEQERYFMMNRHYQGDAVISEELRDLIGAQYLRRTSTFLEDRWLICWEDRILYLYANWPLTVEQVTIVAQRLAP